jgi:type IV pilus assembly protein PilC
MPAFDYVGLDAAGTICKGSVDSDSHDHVRRLLKGQGIYAREIKENTRRLNQNSSVSLQQLASFTRSLALYLKADLPLLKSLELIRRQQSSKNYQNVISSIIESLKSGHMLSESLAPHPSWFNPFYITMIKVGETSGNLASMFQKLSDHYEQILQARKRWVSAMIYPAFIVCAASITLLLLTTFVVPRFKIVFRNILPEAEWPLATSMVFAVSDFCSHHFIFLIGTVLFVLILITWSRSRKILLNILDHFTSSLPWVGDLKQAILLTQLSHAMNALLGSGVSILQSLQLVRNLMPQRVASALDQCSERLRHGTGISQSFQETKQFPSLFLEFISIGEETGDLPAMLQQAARTYEEESTTRLARLVAVAEPALVMIVAVFVGVMVLALFLPLLQMVQSLSS